MKALSLIFAIFLSSVAAKAEVGHSVNIPLSEGKVAHVKYIKTEGGIQVRRFELTGGDMLTEADKNVLRNYIEFRATKSNEQSDLITFMLTQMPVGEKINTYENKSPEKLWTMICNKVGKSHMGEYTVGKRTVSETATVGDEATGCFGRCGASCGMLLFRTQYTQECFDHDLCHRRTGENLGVCEDEFWAASDGFLSAPNCF